LPGVKSHAKLLSSKVLTLLDIMSSSYIHYRDNNIRDWRQSTIFEEQSMCFLKTTVCQYQDSERTCKNTEDC